MHGHFGRVEKLRQLDLGREPIAGREPLRLDPLTELLPDLGALAVTIGGYGFVLRHE